MPEISEIYFANAAQAVNKGVSGSEALKATTIAIAEMDDGAVHAVAVTMFDAIPDSLQPVAAAAALAAHIAAITPTPTASEQIDAHEPTPADPAETLTGGEGGDTVAADAGADTTTAPAGDASVGPSSDETQPAAGNDTVTAEAGSDTTTAPANDAGDTLPPAA